MATTPAKTTPAAKQTPAPATPAPAKQAEAPKFSLGSLAPVAIAVPESTRQTPSGRTARDNSLVEGWLRDLDKTRPSGDAMSKEARALPNVPVDQLPEIRTRFVQAAAKLKIGVSLTVAYVGAGGKETKQQAAAKLPDSVKAVTLIYVTRKRKESKKNATPQPTSAPATPQAASVPATDAK